MSNRSGGRLALYQRAEHGFGHGGGGAAILTLDSAIPQLQIPTGTLDKLRAQLADADLIVDLGARIGSADWWRGFATCAALCATAIMLGPDFAPLPGTNPAPYSEASFNEVRTLAIAPLAYGGDTGRRMAPTEAVVPLTDVPERPAIDLTATLGQGDGFARVLQRAGASKDDAGKVASMIAGIMPLADLKPGTRMQLTLGRRTSKSQPRPLETLAFRARFDLSLAVERVNGALRLRRIPIAVDDTPLRIRGTVGSSLYRSARAAGAPAKAVETYIRALSQHLSIGNDVNADARFDLIVEHRRAATGEVEVGQLIYAGLDRGRRKTQLLKWKTAGKEQWFEASGVGEKRGVMRAPVTGRMTSGFGMRRHPLLGYSRFHKGLDFGAPHGAPIVAASDGVISYAGRHGGHGNYVMIKHGGGMATAYAHMSRIAARVGQRVSQGQLIGYVGSTGLSTGPHLHYEVYKNGAAVNPKSISFITTAQLAGAELRHFRAKLSSLLAVKPGARGAAVQSAAAEPAGAKTPS